MPQQQTRRGRAATHFKPMPWQQYASYAFWCKQPTERDQGSSEVRYLTQHTLTVSACLKAGSISSSIGDLPSWRHMDSITNTIPQHPMLTVQYVQGTHLVCCSHLSTRRDQLYSRLQALSAYSEMKSRLFILYPSNRNVNSNSINSITAQCKQSLHLLYRPYLLRHHEPTESKGIHDVHRQQRS